MIKRFILVVVTLFTLLINAETGSGENSPTTEATPLFENKEKLVWDMEFSEFFKYFIKSRFRWVSKSKRANSFNSVTFGEILCCETIVDFEDGKVDEIVFSVYNRGDAKPISKATFAAKRKKVYDTVKKIAGKVKVVPTKKRVKFAVNETFTWTIKPNYIIKLASSYSRKHKVNGKTIPERFEYIKLTISKYKRAEKKSLFAQSEKFNAKANVKKSDNGTVEIINVPMVDQGQKGYCVAATVARIMQYYQLDCDQHSLAQYMNTTADGGTSSGNMYEMMKKLGVKLRIKIKEFDTLDYKALLKMMKNYNKAAKKKKLPELEDFDKIYTDPFTIAYNFVRQQPELFVESRLKSTTDFKKFKTNIQKTCSSGVPIAWTVMLGIVKEGVYLPQSIGGHMRLIIGYNYKTPGKETIIYTDSWGSAHIRKEMPLADAWAITTGTYAIYAR